MSIKFTPSQQKAIHDVDRSILISAGAGSGKTAVLSERVVAHVKRGIKLDELVVLTFTNAAAKEMKNRIRKRLMEEERNPQISLAITQLDSASIQTFDSYALSIVRQFGYLRNLSNGVQIGDQAELNIVKKDIIDRLFLEQYQAKNQRFLTFITRYEIKDDQMIKTMIYDFYNELSMHNDFEQLLENYQYEDEDKAFSRLFKRYESIVFETIEAIESTIERALDELTDEKSLEYIDDFRSTLSSLLKAEDYQAVYTAINTIESLPRLNAASRALRSNDNLEELEVLNSYKDELKKLYELLKNTYLCKTKTQHRQDFKASREDYPLIIEMLNEFHHRYQNWQYKNEKMDFSSVARLALDLVSNESRVHETLSQQVYEIMVDEYQDTNRLQEAFIESLQAQNIYTVGDIKQSIYRFRHAEPSLFMDRFNRYLKGDGEVISLNKNFRSRANLLHSINTIFERIMDAEIGGIDYCDNDQPLHYGNKAYDQEVDDHYQKGISIALYDIEDDEVNALVESKRLDTSLMEMFFVGKTIQEEVGKRLIHDHKSNQLRPAKYSDYAILISVSKQFDEIRKIFEYLGIPLSIAKDESLIDNYDIDLYRNTLRMLYAFQDEGYFKRYAKHAFMSIARSYAFAFDDDLIVNQVYHFPKHPKEFSAYVKPAFQSFFKDFMMFAKRCQYEPIDHVFLDLMEHFNYQEALVKVPDTVSAKARMDYLIKVMTRFSFEHKSLSDIVRYFDRLTFDDLDVRFDTSSKHTVDQVRLMTIHKSKGLEFPIVFLPNLDRKFSRSHQKNYAFNRELGFILSHDDKNGLSQSFVHDLYKYQELRDDISERIRVFYVALTRAKEACIIPLLNESKHRFRYYNDNKVIDYDRIHHFKSYHNMIHAVLPYLANCQTMISLSDYGLTEAFKFPSKIKEVEHIEVPMKEYQESIYQVNIKQTQKFSASIEELISKEQYEAIQRGNQLHEIFEMIEFSEPLDQQIKELHLDSNTEKIVRAFFESKLIKELEIIQAYKEFPFSVTDENHETTGFIDLLLECQDRWVIIDYKLKNIHKNEYIEQIKGYQSILNSLSNKRVSGYLYSLIDQEFKKVL